MNNTITLNNKEYNRDELSVETNQLIERISLVQAELNKQSILLASMELGSKVLIDQLTKMLESNEPLPTTSCASE